MHRASPSRTAAAPPRIGPSAAICAAWPTTSPWTATCSSTTSAATTGASLSRGRWRRTCSRCSAHRTGRTGGRTYFGTSRRPTSASCWRSPRQARAPATTGRSGTSTRRWACASTFSSTRRAFDGRRRSWACGCATASTGRSSRVRCRPPGGAERRPRARRPRRGRRQAALVRSGGGRGPGRLRRARGSGRHGGRPRATG